MCQEWLEKDAEKHRQMQHALGIHKVQKIFLNLQSWPARALGVQVGLRSSKATRLVHILNDLDLYKVVAPKASGSGCAACWGCLR